jgi:hypothetical protein
MMVAMATKKIVEYVDDVNGQVLDDAGRTVKFGLDGVDYEIDLGSDNVAALERTFGFYIARARKTSRPTLAKPARRDPEQLAKIREWAKENGLPAPERGRIPQATEAAYHEHGGAPIKRRGRKKATVNA